MLANLETDLYTYRLDPPVAFILSLLFSFVFLFCMIKDVIPSIKRWKNRRLRVIWFYSLVALAALGMHSIILVY